nr:hypothetical protein [Bradyrhizobium sp.]
MPQQFFEFREGHFVRIEIGAVGRQEQKARAGACDEVHRLFVLVARQIIEDHRVALAQNRGENLLDIGEETFRFDRPIEHKGRNQTFSGKTGQKRRRFPMTVRRMADGARTNVSPGVTAGHRGCCESLVQENQSAAEAFLHLPPRFSSFSDVGTILLAGVHGCLPVRGRDYAELEIFEVRPLRCAIAHPQPSGRSDVIGH